MTDNDLALQEEVSHLGQQLFGSDTKKCASFTKRLWDIYTRVQGKDFFLVHNPGGWGSTYLEDCLEWERSIVEGVSATVEELGHSPLLIQYFRSGSNWWAHARDVIKEARFFLTGKSSQAVVAAAELRFITKHHGNLKVILVGASQGAAFGNAVMRHLNGVNQVYSIELGIFFPHVPRRVITDRTLAIDNNGLMPDPMCRRNLWAGFKAYITAPFRWIKYRRQGNPQKFTFCVSAPGHEYNWEHPKVQQQIRDFLTTNFGTKSKLEGGAL